MISKPTLFFALLMLAACRAGDADVPPQSGAAIEALIGDVLRGCGAPLSSDGAFDQRAMVASGWQERSRITRFQGADQPQTFGSLPSLRNGEYEATEWTLPGRIGVVSVIRQDSATRQQTADLCSVAARLAQDASVDSIVSAISARLAQPVAREGDLPRGGDFLMPRTDRAPHAWYWPAAQHDVYLVAFGARDVRLEVYAMADRSRLDEYSPDRPERRIPQAAARP